MRDFGEGESEDSIKGKTQLERRQLRGSTPSFIYLFKYWKIASAFSGDSLRGKKINDKSHASNGESVKDGFLTLGEYCRNLHVFYMYCLDLRKVLKETLWWKQCYYMNAYMWNLERWYWWTYLQSNNEDADIENKPMDTVGERECGMNWESSMQTHTLPYVKQTASGNLLCGSGNSHRGSVSA